MNLDVTDRNAIKKYLFTLKPKQRDGLILNVHHTNKKKQRIRFIHTCFSIDGQTLASADNDGNIYVINFLTNKFWQLPKVVDTCTCIKFSKWTENDILVATTVGNVKIVDIDSAIINGDLIGHKYEVNSVSYAQEFLCLTSSRIEAIIWDLRTNSKIHVLNLEKDNLLKEVIFMPVSSSVLAYYDDDVIEVWKYGTFESMMILQPSVWNNHCIKNITVTLNGQLIVLACHPAQLAIFLLNNWKLSRIVTLPEYIKVIKRIDFIPNLNDGGCNRILAILSGQGNLYYYDLEQNCILSELVLSHEITRYDCASKGFFMACVLSSGDVNIYDFLQYIKTAEIVKAEIVPVKRIKPRECIEKLGLLKEQIKEMLDIDKLRQILKQYGEYPDMYRTKIWEQLLELPNNRDQYNAVINHRIIQSFPDLYEKYPLEDKRSLKNLRKVLDNLVTWSPFFANVEYLPVFLFPFVKIFHNKPVACFEAACIIIVNWCQFWFEYFPLPPINILAIIENILLEHDPELLNHLMTFKIEPVVYAWPLLETAFSEILTTPQWKRLWDHVFTTSDPTFLLFATVAYNIIQRRSLLSFDNHSQFVSFYRNQHAFEMKKLISKTYKLSENTADGIHPKQYLKRFRKIDPGQYPEFNDYPKTVITQAERIDELDSEIGRMRLDEGDLLAKRLNNLRKIDDLAMDEEERRRMMNLEKVIKSKIMDKQLEVKNSHQRLSELRQKFKNEESCFMKLYQQRVLNDQERTKAELLKSLNVDLDLERVQNDYATQRAKEDLNSQYSDFVNLNKSIEATSSSDDSRTKLRIQKDSKTKKREPSDEKLELLNVAAGIATTEIMIKKIQEELEREESDQIDSRGQKLANLRVLKLQKEGADLVMTVDKLMKVLSEKKSNNV